MATPQDASIGIGVETTYKTGVTPTRWFEFTAETLDWNKNIVQGTGLRVGRRVNSSPRRVVTSAMGSGDVTLDCISKGMGLLWQAMLGSGTSTLVSTGVYQQVFTLGDTPGSVTLQKGIVEFGGTVDAYTYLGAMVSQWVLNFPNNDKASVQVSFVAGDLTTATAYTSPSNYPGATASLFHFQNATIQSGTLTAPTATALGVGGTPVADVRGGSLTVNNNLATDRLNMGGGGRIAKPTVGLRDISGSLDVEYDATTWRDAVLNEVPMNLVLNYTGAALTTGNETLQVIVPEIKFDSPLSQTNGDAPIVTSLTFQGLDNQVAAQPLWVVCRTADTAL